ncbi:MAG: DUF3795 domain-containing protein [Candidatus Izemoplasmatales bacterium]|jgi:hypothetical protein
MFTAELIAPCGANCGICMAFLRTNNRCLGCRSHDSSKPKACVQCRIKTCCEEKGYAFCYQCDRFPCPLIIHLDKRYRLNYSYSMIECLLDIQKKGIDYHLLNCEKKYVCDCGGIICVHRGYCTNCGKIRYINVSNSRKQIK